MLIRLYSILLLLLLGSAGTTAQPTYTAANLPTPGTTITWSEADTNGIQPGAAGEGVTWDFSGLTLTGSTYVLNYTEPAGSPYAAEFPSATLAEESDTAWSYFTLANGRWTRLGESSEAFQSGEWENGLDFAKVPWSYGESFEDDAKHTFETEGVTTRRSGTITAEYDGYGTLILPQGTFADVLRLHYRQSIIDSASIPAGPVTITTTITTEIEAWVWFQEGNNEPLLTVDTAWISIRTGPPANQTQQFRYPHVQVSQQLPSGGGNDPVTPTLAQPADEARIGGTTVGLEWVAAGAPNTTQVQVSLDAAFSAIVVDESVEGTTHSVDGLELGRTYYWRARTVTPGIVKPDGGRPQAESDWSAVRSFTMVPEAPTLRTPENNGTLSGMPKWSWTWSPTTGKSQIQIAPTSAFEEVVVDATVNADTYEGVVPEGQYYWRVRCLASNDVAGVWSDPWSFTAGPTSVIEVSATDIRVGPNPSDGRILIQGHDLASFSEFQVYDASGVSVMRLAIAPGSTHTTLELKVAGMYYVVLSRPHGRLNIPVMVLP